MGTKKDAGAYDCYAAAEPDEPMFILLARDPQASLLVHQWAATRAELIDRGVKPESDRAQVAEAYALAAAMGEWRWKHRQGLMMAVDFDELDGMIRRVVKSAATFSYMVDLLARIRAQLEIDPRQLNLFAGPDRGP